MLYRRVGGWIVHVTRNTLCVFVCVANYNVTLAAPLCVFYTGHFIMFSVITDIYNKKPNSIKVGPLVFLLQMFAITVNIMKRHVYVEN